MRGVSTVRQTPDDLGTFDPVLDAINPSEIVPYLTCDCSRLCASDQIHVFRQALSLGRCTVRVTKVRP